MIHADDVIAAIATPASPAVRGVIRCCGNDVAGVLERLGLTVPRRTRRVPVRIQTGPPIGLVDASLAYWCDDRSYTGSPTAEIHTLGSPPVLDAILSAMIAAGARPAAPGEFTLRAFLSGRLDLTQAEAVLAVIDSPGGESFDAALTQLAGNLSQPLSELRRTLLQLLADIEAGLDFVDEDIQFISDDQIVDRLDDAASVLTAARNKLASRVQSSVRPVVAIRGFPNAGKSRLLNRLAGRPAAIVSPTAGTTRDVVRQTVNLDGIDVELWDTAGVETPPNRSPHRSLDQSIDSMATSMNRHGRHSDRVAARRVWCVNLGDPNADEHVRRLRRESSRGGDPGTEADLWVATQTDRYTGVIPDGWLGCSSVTGEGIESLRTAIVRSLDAGGVTSTAIRCHDALRRAADAIAAATALARGGDDHDLVAVEIRLALATIGQVTGTVYTDDILDQIFSRFCVGK